MEWNAQGIIALIMAIFSIFGAIDRIFGNRIGIGREFERGVMLLGTMAFSMVGMIVISPFIAMILRPVLEAAAKVLPFDPSIVPATLFANDMGGAALAKELALNPEIGKFNGMVVSSMMGCTISFTIPVVLGMVKKEQQDDVFLGLLCGIVTIPIGCFVGGLVAGIPLVDLLIDLLPLAVFSALLAIGLLKIPKICVKIFNVIGVIIRTMVIIGLVIGIFSFLTKIKISDYFDTYENGIAIVANASAVMTGAFPLILLISRLLRKPLALMGHKMKINDTAAVGLLSSLATSMTTFDMMADMDKKGVVFNSAFAVSAAFTFAGHLAFTLAFCPEMLVSVIVSKLVAGVLALVSASLIYNRVNHIKREKRPRKPKNA